MLTLAQCRLSDPRLARLSDEELLKVRAELYNFAKLGLQDFFEKQGGSTSSPVVIYPSSHE